MNTASKSFEVINGDFVLTSVGGRKYQVNNRTASGLVKMGVVDDLDTAVATINALIIVCKAFDLE